MGLKNGLQLSITQYITIVVYGHLRYCIYIYRENYDQQIQAMDFTVKNGAEFHTKKMPFVTTKGQLSSFDFGKETSKTHGSRAALKAINTLVLAIGPRI